MTSENIKNSENQEFLSERIKLKKNSKGGYEWEIKILPKTYKNIRAEDLDRLEIINKELEEKFGDKK
jgi:hypothetical protein